MKETKPIIAVALTALAIWLIVQLDNSHLMTLIVGAPWIDVPFAAGQKGAVVEQNFHVPRDEYFAFTLDLYFKPGDPQDRAKIAKLAGYGGRDRNGNAIDTGIPIPVKLTVFRQTDDVKSIVLQEEADSEETEGWGAAFYKRVSAGTLRKGDYTIRIESLAEVPELTDVPVRFGVRAPGNLK